MQEFAFEVALCAHLEAHADAIVSRQLGAGVHGRRIADIVTIDPGPEFDARTRLTPATIPHRAIESGVGVGEARYWKDAFAEDSTWAREAIERAVEIGFFERERRGGREFVRQVARYPDWIGPITGIENKPDLDRPGALETQLRTDVSLGLFDRVVLATASHVTGAHRNRIPDEVGIWRFDPDSGTREVLREPTPLQPDEPGVELLDRHPGHAEIRVASADEKARARRRLAERAYGKGWRTYDLPACANAECGGDGEETCGVSESQPPGVPTEARGLPYCAWKNRIVRPVEECGPDCAGYDPADPPRIDLDAERDRRSPWVRDPAGKRRRQAGLDRFL